MSSAFARARGPQRIAMSLEPTRSLARGGFGRASGWLPGLLVSTTLAAIGPAALAAGVGDDPTAQQQASENPRAEEDHQAKQDDEPTAAAAPDKPGAPSTAPGLCEALAAAATANGLPADFFTRLIWQESRFKPDAISRAGAQGIAQFMPATARFSGLENPFDPREAIAKSGQLLRSLQREFGNLGLAAAAYNAGSGRARDWLGGRGPLPRETQAYVRRVTGHPVEEWARSQGSPERASVEVVPCNLPATALGPAASPPIPEPVKPWGVEVIG